MLLRSRFLPAEENSRIRFVQDDTDKRARWVAVGSEPDRVLAERNQGGVLLVSPEFDLAPLRETGSDEELRQLLTGRFQLKTREENDARIRELLAQCPRARYLPMLDLDVKGGTREEALAWARRLDLVARRRGLGVPSWHASGSEAGVHGDLLAPDGFAHPDLLEIARMIVLEVAREVGIPLLSQFREKATRPPVVLDDTLFRRNPQGRGVLWRPSGATKPRTGLQKTPLDLEGYEIEYIEPLPGDRAAFELAASLVERQRQLQGARFGRAGGRGRRTVKPCVLPPGTRLLERFAQALERVLGGRGAHDVRVAAAGWLLGLGVAPEIVEASLARATGNPEDAADSVRSTARRVAAGAPAKALPALQELLGAPACVEFREALVEDGVAAARKTYWTDPERALLMRCHRGVERAHPGRLALRDGARCGTFSMPYECPSHGLQGVRSNVEERELTCPHCRESRWHARLEVLRETWTEPSYGVLTVRARAGEDVKRALVEARRAAKELCDYGTWRWFLANDHAILVFPAFDADPVSKTIAHVRESGPEPREEIRFDARDRAAAWRNDVKPEDARVVSREELLELVGRAWRSPGVAFQGVVESGDEEAVKDFPWLTMKNAQRTRASDAGSKLFPWPSAKAIRERAKARAREARGGIDPTLCDAHVGIDDFGAPVPCLQPYHVHVDHLPTGVRLTSEPIVGRFPMKHELELKLELTDPELLRDGYERQRSFARLRL